MRVDRQGDVFVAHLGDDENRYKPQSIAELRDVIESAPAAGARALVLVGDGRFWSNGLDQTWLAENRGGVGGLLDSLHDLYAEALRSSIPIVGALQGHTYAGGAIMALTLDYRIMREDRGYFCLPEVEIGLAMTPGMVTLLESVLSPPARHDVIVLSRRYTAPEAFAAGIVNEIAPANAVVEQAITAAEKLAHLAGPTLALTKRRLYRKALEALSRRMDPDREIVGL